MTLTLDEPHSDCRLNAQVFANELNISMKMVRKIMIQDLGKRIVCFLFIPHNLSEEQKQFRMNQCDELIDNANTDFVPHFHSNGRRIMGLPI
ncbi:hypothetical protein NPIL_495801 [Nephila pilipes]|uniref:Uncharacterized protein n=1 Tax=Nephila pilipes TaxID=299642 RepID=A0A8X6PW23_NEPPI|nr:hypothetical protein NPIL_495801 [Nephila pilipes]